MQHFFLILVLLLVSGALTAAGLLIRFLGLHVLGQVIAHQNQVVVGLTLWDASLRSSGLLRRFSAAVFWLRIHVRHGLRLWNLAYLPWVISYLVHCLVNVGAVHLARLLVDLLLSIGLLCGRLHLLLLKYAGRSHGIHVLKVVHVLNGGIGHVHTLFLIVASGLECCPAHIVHAEGAVEVVVLLLAFEHAVDSVVHLPSDILVHEVNEWVA